MTTKQITMADINRITVLYMCNDVDRLAGAMLACAGTDDENDTGGECCKELLDFCKQEGIDPLPAIKKALGPSPFDKIWRR